MIWFLGMSINKGVENNMIKNDVCKNLAVYHKLDVDEIIEVGDIVMLDPATNTVTRAVANNPR